MRCRPGASLPDGNGLRISLSYPPEPCTLGWQGVEGYFSSNLDLFEAPDCLMP